MSFETRKPIYAALGVNDKFFATLDGFVVNSYKTIGGARARQLFGQLTTVLGNFESDKKQRYEIFEALHIPKQIQIQVPIFGSWPASTYHLLDGVLMSTPLRLTPEVLLSTLNSLIADLDRDGIVTA